ncbi:MAG: hypothetical protein E3J90_03270 [Promethearchaeota archaeon]|nr:MAG: hypothetical protein E3J90_03270 [Candidatus Lokiarchaeota archaeon]
MTDQELSNDTLREISELFSFLTEGQPTPDDEIEAKDKLINYFTKLKNNSTDSEQKVSIEEILKKLDDWDTLDLWFSETTLPATIKSVINIPDDAKLKKEQKQETVEEPTIESKNGDSEIDLTDIFSMVSDQFKGEIESLKGKIDDLKKELEKKDDRVSRVTTKRKVHKITPSKNVRLAPPKIRIPVIKKLLKPTQTSKQSIPKTPIMPDKTEENSVDLEPQKVNLESSEEQLTPIPFAPIEKPIGSDKPNLTPIPKKKPKISPMVIEESEDIEDIENIPFAAEKRKITSLITEEPEKIRASQTSDVMPFLNEKPKISAMRIEEIESESIVSSGSDLFNVFSSMGNKSSVKPKKITGLTEIPAKVEVKKKEEKKKKASKDTQESEVMPFIDFNKVDVSMESSFDSPNLDNISDDKDTLYQELIALEGKRYSLERSFKDLEKGFNKGSIPESEFKKQNNGLKTKMNEITSRINKIRRLISSL